MADDDILEPRLGRLRQQGGKRARSYLGRVLAAANLARVGGRPSSKGATFLGSRIGRGAGIGRMLGSRGASSAQSSRRVIVKASIVKLAGRGADAAAAHLRYLQRDGTTREGERSSLYGAESDVTDAKAFHDRGTGDRHQFRFIVSPEDGDQYDELKPFVRRLMIRVEEDLGTKLDWVAVDHFNTGHPHTHIVVRGKDHLGADLVIAREYLTVGLRERAAELIDLDLGPRSLDEIQRSLRAEVDQERLTSIDRSLLRAASPERVVLARARDPFEQSCRAGRLAKLGKLGLADRLGADRWRLAEAIDDTLRRMGERDDIIRTMQREISAANLVRPTVDQVIYDPAAGGAPSLVGRIVSQGLADEHADRQYLVVDATDGRTHFVPIGTSGSVEPFKAGAIVRIDANRPTVRDVDRTVHTIAAANGGRYDVDLHLQHDRTATEDFADAHVRRLEMLRRAGVAVSRDATGSWAIPDDHLERVAAHEAARRRDRPVSVRLLSHLPLDRLIDAEAATWLDREALAEVSTPLRAAGFGQDVLDAQARRRQWLVQHDFAAEAGGVTSYRAGMLAALQRRELTRVAAALSEELRLPFGEAMSDRRIEGVLRRRVDLASGRFALVERSRDFTLVPWRPVLERQVGKSVAGILRGDGISWTFGRGRQGPTVS